MLLRIAYDFARLYVYDKPEILGVLLVGSSTIGICDELTDLDLLVFTDEQSVNRRKADGKGYNEEYHMEGVEICVDWQDIESIERSILAQRDDAYFWSMSNSKILYDPLGRLHEALAKLKPYPLELKRRKVFKQFYLLRARVEDMKKCVERGEHEAASMLVFQALDHLIRLLFLLEGEYLPIEKWRFYEMRRLHVGEKYLPEIRQILVVSRLEKDELLGKSRAFERIFESIRSRLLELGIPDRWLGEDWWRYEPDWRV